MLKVRVITALVLLSLLGALFWANSFPLFAAAAAVFFGAAIWESLRLFKSERPVIGATIWAVVFSFVAASSNAMAFFALCTAIWFFRLAPALAIGLPPMGGVGNRLLGGIYNVTVLGCFVAILVLFRHSALYLISVMAIVWIADIGAYFFGKAFGKHKLAVSISPGKSWEGAVGGWLAVLVIAGATTFMPMLEQTFAVRLQAKFGWLGLMLAMTLLVAGSIVGDLFESQLKRRAGMKDSSHLLPGHGGILDRIDALIPTLPMAVLLNAWL